MTAGRRIDEHHKMIAFDTNILNMPTIVTAAACSKPGVDMVTDPGPVRNRSMLDRSGDREISHVVRFPSQIRIYDKTK
jgi:hypothetical protein